MSEFTENDHEDDEAGDPSPEFVLVHDLVAKEGDEERACSDDDDPGPARHVGVDRMDQLRSDDDVHRRPSNAGQDVEDGDQFHAIVAEEVSRQHHLPQAKPGAEGAEEANGGDAQQVDEEDREQSVNETQLEDRDGQGSDGKRGYHHVG